MLLLIDSGSTKTEWTILVEKQIVKTFFTNGFNPYYSNSEVIASILEAELPADVPFNDVLKLVYYGAGCSTETNCDIVAQAMRQFFKNAEIKIHHDLLAAAHALLGRNEGIACILGTGSNSCYYDGKKIVENVPSLGYVLGDDGAGSYIGKEVLKAYLYDDMPADLKSKFESTFDYSLDDILNQIYHGNKPAKFMASFARFAGENQKHLFMEQLVSNVFDSFIKVQLSKYSRYQDVPVCFTGSVSYYFREILEKRLKNAGIQMGIVMSNPSVGLIQYHTSM